MSSNIVDLKEECSVSESQSSSSNSNNSNGNSNGNSNVNSNGNSNNGELKRCTDCQTTTTPLWRGGPAGPKTLCNACGIKYHKKRRALLGLDKSKVDKCKKKSTTTTTTTTITTNNSKSTNGLGMPLKIKVMASGMRQSDKLGEVEQAAMLLMALSYGSVYA